MSMYRIEWPCCGDVTETEAWQPEHCPFCGPATIAAGDAPVRPAARVVRATLYAYGNDLVWTYWGEAQPISWSGYNDGRFWTEVCKQPHWKTRTINGKTYTLNAETDELTITEGVTE